MKIYLHCFLFLILFATLDAKSQYVSLEDSVYKVLDQSHDTVKVKLYLMLVDHLWERDYNKSLELVQIAVDLSEKNNFLNGIIQSYHVKGMLKMDVIDYPKSLEAFLKSYKLGIEHNIKSASMAGTVLMVGRIYYYYARKDIALKYANEAEEILNSIKPKKGNLYVYNNLASLYIDLNELEKAYKSLITIKNTLADYNRSNIQYNVMINNLSVYYQAKGNYKKAISYAFEALQIYDDSTKLNSGTYLCVINNIGNIYFHNKNYDSAVYFLNKSLNAESRIDKRKWNAINSRDLSYVYLAKGDLKKAERFALDYLEMSKKSNFNEDLRRGYKLLYQINDRKQNHQKASRYLLRYLSLNDSINLEERAAIVMNIYLKNMITEKEAENKNLQTENKKKELVIKDKQIFQIFLVLISTVIFIFTIIVIYLFIQYRINNDLLKKQSEEIIQKNNQLASQNELLTELNEEVKGIVGIVSHDLKAPISRIESFLNFIALEKQNLSVNQQKYLNIALNEANNSKELITKILDIEERNEHQKLIAEPVALNTFVKDIVGKYHIFSENKEITIIENLPSKDLVIHIYTNHVSRILDNLLSNALKFSEKGKKIYLDVTFNKTMLQVTIKDEGQGMSEIDLKNIYKKYHKLTAKPTAGENSSGLGLYIVKKIIDEVNGTIEVESKLSIGTTFRINIPFVA